MLDPWAMAKVAAMIATVIAFLIARERRMTITATALLANWFLCSLPAWVWQDYAAWRWFFVFDALTAMVILWHPKTRWQAIIGGAFIAQLLMHSAYGIFIEQWLHWGFNVSPLTDERHALATDFYLDALSEVGRAQLLILWGGGLYEYFRRTSCWRGFFRGRQLALEPGVNRVESGVP